MEMIHRQNKTIRNRWGALSPAAPQPQPTRGLSYYEKCADQPFTRLSRLSQASSSRNKPVALRYLAAKKAATFVTCKNLERFLAESKKSLTGVKRFASSQVALPLPVVASQPSKYRPDLAVTA